MRTIAAIATPLLNCAIHIIRVSGPNTFDVVNKILKKPVKLNRYSIQHNYVIDQNKNIIDEVLVNVFIKPYSYSGEDSVEINCHGGVIVAKKILDLLIINGCEMANNGEFSQQAFLNKKIDYQQIEGINNLIHANNEIAIRFAINAVVGKDSDQIKIIREKVFHIMGSIEVNIDYPEYDDVPQYSNQEIINMLKQIQKEIEKIIFNSKLIRPAFEGFTIAIIGKPNVGKSSLLNKLTKQDKAIVHNSEGTTRDIIESNLIFNNIPLKILDTAGIRNSKDEIEQLGIKKAFDASKQADLVIYLIDANDEHYQDTEIFKFLENNQINYLKVFNKTDLLKIDNEINISCKDNNLDELINAMKKYFSEITNLDRNNLVLQSDRQIVLIEKINQIINDVISDLNNNIPIDLVQTSLEEIISLLNDILGISFKYDKLDELFSKFCIGK